VAVNFYYERKEGGMMGWKALYLTLGKKSNRSPILRGDSYQVRRRTFFPIERGRKEWLLIWAGSKKGMK